MICQLLNKDELHTDEQNKHTKKERKFKPAAGIITIRQQGADGNRKIIIIIIIIMLIILYIRSQINEFYLQTVAVS